MSNKENSEEKIETKPKRKMKKRAIGIINPVTQDLYAKLEKAELQITEHQDSIVKLQRVVKGLKAALQVMDPETYTFEETEPEIEEPTESWKNLIIALFQENPNIQYSPREITAYLETKEFYDRCSPSMLTSWLQSNAKDDISPVVKFRRGYYGVEG